MKVTKAQQKVIDRLKEIGGAGWLGSGIDRQTQTTNAVRNFKLVKDFYGKSEAERYKNRLKRYNITNKGAWCSTTTFEKLMANNIIVPIDNLPGCFKLT